MASEGKHNRKVRTFGQAAADIVTTGIGSWGFIIVFFVFLALWMAINSYFLIFGKFDPYPFILLNLALSCLAAIQAPVIMMSQNRAAERDRVTANRDYLVDRKAEREIKILQKDMIEIKAILLKQPKTEEIDKLQEEILMIQSEIEKHGKKK